MTTIDFDAPRRCAVELDEDSVEELQARRVPAQSPVADLDEPDAVEGFDLPGTELMAEDPTMSVVVPCWPTSSAARAASWSVTAASASRTAGARRLPRVCLTGGPRSRSPGPTNIRPERWATLTAPRPQARAACPSLSTRTI
jgi:hypothetical protein